MTNYDTIIVGAGAAGIAAGERLQAAGQRILLLEARDRIGGRVWSDDTFADFPVELGAEFIHGERAVTHGWVAAAGFTTLDAPRYPKLRWGDGGPALLDADLPPNTRQLLAQIWAAYRALPAHAAQLATTDCSLADYLRGQGFPADALTVADVLLAQTCCASIETLSCADLVREMAADHAGSVEFYIAEGYGALLAWQSRDLPIRLNTPVQAICWDDGGVIVVTADATFQACRCILTVPVSLLQRGIIHFDPPLSQRKAQAIATFRTEAATKLIYRFTHQFWGDELVFLAHRGLAARWWTPGYGRPGAAVLTCYVTAARAEQFDRLPAAEALALGLAEICTLLNRPDLARQCMDARRVAWAHEPFTLGGYAHVPPGAAWARPALAAPEGQTLFFAGEATAYETNPQTVHGAIESGWRAAAECVR
jgi:monoamine oxidase